MSNLLDIITKNISEALTFVGMTSFQIYNLEKINNNELLYNISIQDEILIGKSICSDLQRYLEGIWEDKILEGTKGKYSFYFPQQDGIIFNITKDRIFLTINILFDLHS